MKSERIKLCEHVTLFWLRHFRAKAGFLLIHINIPLISGNVHIIFSPKKVLTDKVPLTRAIVEKEQTIPVQITGPAHVDG